MDFDDFQLSEYNNIANAHFETLKQLYIFFRYYLIVISAPTALLLISKPSSNFLETLFNDRSPNINNVICGTFFIVLAFVGVGIFLYVVNLRHDAVLYARTVNGIRKYFYDLKNLDPNEEQEIRVLPKQVNLPNYLEHHLFLPIVGVFALINSIYFYVGLIIFTIACIPNVYYYLIPLLVMFIFGHYFLYRYLARHREN